MKNFLAWFQRLFSAEWLPVSVAIGGAGVFLWLSVQYSHTQASLLDEGAYLLKGYYFAIGKYWPYQDYGFWTNHMPLAFLIPGYVEKLFGVGLRTGRYLSIFFGLSMVAGLWLITRRFGGKWLAALAVWGIVLNPAVIKMYSLANSQSLVACILVWILVLTLGENKPLWQLLAGCGLAGILLMTRVNMAPVLLVVIIYVIWEYDWKKGSIVALSGMLPVLIGHAVFWPGILKIWAHWIPESIVPFLSPWAHPPGSAPSWNPDVTLQMRLASFIDGIRFHFIALVGAISVWFLWPRPESWKSKNQWRVAISLMVLLILLVLAHMWASLGNNYCVFCYPVYLSFFTMIGLILIVITFGKWRRTVSAWRGTAIVFLILVLSTGTGYGASGEIGSDLLPLLDIPVPRIKSMHILPGSVRLAGPLQSKLGLTPVKFTQLAQVVLSILVGLLVGVIVLLIALWVKRYFSRKGRLPQVSYATFALLLFLALGYILSPTTALGAGYTTYDCGGDVLKNYERAGASLAMDIPKGSLVYWRGGDSAVPLLYLQDVEIFPAQINGDYSYRLGGDPDALEKYGFWSESLAQEWAKQADFILIEERLYGGWLGQLVESGNFDELEPTSKVLPCDNESSIHIYQRKP